ncbi:MAG: hypothetical protein Q4B09_11600 [Lachnospiraceae bacterium]|nr:hypothetical protein [Lachnospiraceae bacterium]
MLLAVLAVLLLGTQNVSAARADREEAYRNIQAELQKEYTVSYAEQRDLTGDGEPELLVVYTDGVQRSYDQGAFTSPYMIAVYSCSKDGNVRRLGRLKGLFSDATVGAKIQALAIATMNGRTYIVTGGQNMNYHYNFYAVENGKLALVRTFRCEWNEESWKIDGAETERRTFLRQLRSWQGSMRYVRYFKNAAGGEI